MKIALPDAQGRLSDYALQGAPIEPVPLGPAPARTVFSAAHVVADPFTANDPTGPAALDWEATLAFRRYLADLGLGIAEAMDTAQRGTGLDWPGALELIRQTVSELPDALVFSGCGTDQLDPGNALTLDDVRRAYLDQAAAFLRGEIATDSVILDAGCGTGLTGLALREAGFVGPIDAVYHVPAACVGLW